VRSGGNEKLPLGRLLATTGKIDLREKSRFLPQIYRAGNCSSSYGRKHPHHDGAVFPSSGMVLMNERITPPGA